MTRVSALTQARLRAALSYCPDTGAFGYRERRQGMRGDEAGSIEPRTGYRRLMVDGEKHFAHRLAFLWMIGAWPAQEVDHINGVPGDNRWSNLREATRGENRCNTRKSRGKSTGFKGVSFKKNGFEASIRKDLRSYYLGRFKTAEAAHEAYKSASQRLHGEFANP